MSQVRVLVVDDDDVILALLNCILVEDGYAVTCVSTGSQAKALLDRDQAFDAVLLDRMLPDMDGMDILHEMKSRTGLRDIPVVFQTVMAQESDIQDGLRSGAYYYLLKPLDPRLVLQIVSAVTNEYRERRKAWADMEGLKSALGLMRRGLFCYQTLSQCHDLAAMLARVCPDPRSALVGLSELMINALEHGNLGIGYAEKSELIAKRKWAAEVHRRQKLPENAKKWVSVQLTRHDFKIRFRVADVGPGFDFTEYEVFKAERMFDSHGRGIYLARMESFDRLEYQGKGNIVIAEVDQAK